MEMDTSAKTVLNGAIYKGWSRLAVSLSAGIVLQPCSWQVGPLCQIAAPGSCLLYLELPSLQWSRLNAQPRVDLRLSWSPMWKAHDKAKPSTLKASPQSTGQRGRFFLGT